MNRFALLVVVMLPLASCAPACFDGLATAPHSRRLRIAPLT